MNPNFTAKLSDTVCSLCRCVDKNFLHHVPNGKICTSCVLFKHAEFYCPLCLELHNGKQKLIRCDKCGSGTHYRCAYCDEEPAEFVCSSCQHPYNLIFNLKDVERSFMVMDMEAARLLLTAARVVQKSISKAYDESVNSAVRHATEALSEKEMAIGALRRFNQNAGN